MLSINDETRAFISTALAGDVGLASLSVAGGTPDILAVHVAPGALPADVSIGRVTYGGKVPFRREVLVELVVRMQRLRWLRWDDFALRMVPPSDDGYDRIKDRTGCGSEFASGWDDMILAACDWIEESGGDPKSGQIKEKFASLRWYHDGLVGELGDEITDAAEHLSHHICEECGALAVPTERRGWWRTRCEEHTHA